MTRYLFFNIDGDVFLQNVIEVFFSGMFESRCLSK